MRTGKMGFKTKDRLSDVKEEFYNIINDENAK
jgi:hypothetical protein